MNLSCLDEFKLHSWILGNPYWQAINPTNTCRVLFLCQVLLLDAWNTKHMRSVQISYPQMAYSRYRHTIYTQIDIYTNTYTCTYIHRHTSIQLHTYIYHLESCVCVNGWAHWIEGDFNNQTSTNIIDVQPGSFLFWSSFSISSLWERHGYLPVSLLTAMGFIYVQRKRVDVTLGGLIKTSWILSATYLV